MVDLVDVTRDAIFLRGQFIHRYAGVEFAVSELLARARQHDDYADLPELPFSWSGKLKSIGKLIDMTGVIDTYLGQLKALLAELPFFERYRHLLVHGLMVARIDEADELVVSLRMYDHIKGEGLAFISLDLPLHQLEELADRLVPLSSGFTALVAEICTSVPLPLVNADAARPLLPKA